MGVPVVGKYRKKPVVVEAVQFKTVLTEEIEAFFGEHPYSWDPSKGIKIPTLEGVMLAEPFDWIIRGVKGELYPCKPDIFDATYEPVSRLRAGSGE